MTDLTNFIMHDSDREILWDQSLYSVYRAFKSWWRNL